MASITPTHCPCASGQPLELCCARLHRGQPAGTPGELMRSRYSAYVLGEIDYLVQTTLPAQQPGLDRAGIEAWSRQSQWLGLTVESELPLPGNPAHGLVTFVARWRDAQGEHSHRERSAFVQHADRWYFIDPTVPLKVGRNDPCPCGSDKKTKKCCGPYLG